MVKSGNSKDKLRLEIVSQKINRVSKLIRGHKKLLVAIGKL